MWTESDSDTFIDYGRYFVPGREAQFAALCSLVPPSGDPFTLWELGCGEGLLAEALLTRFPTATVVGLDGSPAMRERALGRLERFGDRFRAAHFSLAEREWRRSDTPLRAVLSSLVLHHLDGAGKAALYRHLYPLLEPGGVLAIADLVQPATEAGVEIAAAAWDQAVCEQALALDGNDAAYRVFVSEKWNIFRYPDPMDMPSRLTDHLAWLAAAGFRDADLSWMVAGHAVYSARK